MAAIKMSREGARELIGHEGVVLTRYLDTRGVWTLGVGHTAAAGDPDPAGFTGALTLTGAIDLFMSDLERYEAAVARAVTTPLKQHEFDALVSFHFNTGAIATAALTRALNAGDRARAAEQFMGWKKPPEILGRRRKEQALFADGVYANGGRAMLYPASPAGRVDWTRGRRVSLAGL
ncbi:MAG: lysozyme [Caulobacter sp.]|nr:lysozyme [Caulobacter sp.]